MDNLYSGDYKKYVLVPIALFIVFLLMILVFPGIRQGIDLKGGTNIIIRSDKPLDSKKIEGLLRQNYPLTELRSGSVSSPAGGNGLFIQFAENTELSKAGLLVQQAKGELQKNPENAKKLSLESIAVSSKYAGEAVDAASFSPQESVVAAEESLAKAEEAFDTKVQGLIMGAYGLEGDLRFQKTQIGPSLGKIFFELSIKAILMGMFFLVAVVYFFFREPLTSMTVTAASVFDITAALAFMALFGIPLTLTTIPALLMLIGYSVDTEIVMSARVLKRKENTAKERVADSLRTILTMSLTAMAAITVMMVLSYFYQVQVIFEISVVLFFGLAADIVSATLMNAPLVLQHAEKGESH